MILALLLSVSVAQGQTSDCPGWRVLPRGDVVCAQIVQSYEDQIDRSKPAALSCTDSLWQVIRESIDVLAGVKVRQSVVPTLKAAAEACE